MTSQQSGSKPVTVESNRDDLICAGLWFAVTLILAIGDMVLVTVSTRDATTTAVPATIFAVAGVASLGYSIRRLCSAKRDAYTVVPTAPADNQDSSTS